MAMAWAVKTEDAIRSGKFRDASAAEAKLLPDLLDYYLANITPRKAATTLSREKSRLKIISSHPRLKSRTLATLTSADVVDYVDDRRRAGLTNDSIRKELATLSSALEIARVLLHIDLPHGNVVRQARSGLQHTHALKENPARDRRLGPGEEARVLAALPPMVKLAVIIFLETAMRRGELCAARREHVRGSLLEIPKTKTGVARTIPLSSRALAAITELPVRSDGKLLGLSPTWLTGAFEKACKVARIEDLRLHDLRHEATSRFFERGFSIPEVALITGHSDWKMLKRYTNLRPENLVGRLENSDSLLPR